jgi:HlyD family secretion protein
VRKWLLAVVGLLVTLLLMAFVTRGVMWGRHPAAKLARTFAVRRGDIRLIVRETGSVEPFTKVDVKSKVGGRILNVAVREGEHVQAGQLIAEIDPTETRSQVNQIHAQIAGAEARMRQSQTQLSLQKASSRLALADAEQGLKSAQARLAQARRQFRAQPSLTRSAIAEAEASYRAAQASLDALRQSTQPQTEADARSTFNQANATAENAGKQLHRLQSLLAKGFVPQNQVDDAQRDYENACSQRDSAKERLNTMEQRLAAERREAEARVAQLRASLSTAQANSVQDEVRRDELTAAQAAYEQAQVVRERAVAGLEEVAAKQADVEAAQASVKQLTDQLAEVSVRLGDATIRAPMAGIVTKRYVEAGELVTSGIATFSSGMPIVQIADLSRMRVVCQVNEVDVGRVAVGQRAEVVLDAARGERYAGRVVSVAPSAVSAAAGATGGNGAASGIVKFEVKIAVEQSDGRLKPGMSANVDIVTAERKGVLTLPLEAVDVSRRPAQVTVPRGSGTATVKVETGLKNETSVEIRSGLKEGEQVQPAPYRGVARKQIDLSKGPGGNNN